MLFYAYALKIGVVQRLPLLQAVFLLYVLSLVLF